MATRVKCTRCHQEWTVNPGEDAGYCDWCCAPGEKVKAKNAFEVFNEVNESCLKMVRK